MPLENANSHAGLRQLAGRLVGRGVERVFALRHREHAAEDDRHVLRLEQRRLDATAAAGLVRMTMLKPWRSAHAIASLTVCFRARLDEQHLLLLDDRDERLEAPVHRRFALAPYARACVRSFSSSGNRRAAAGRARPGRRHRRRRVQPPAPPGNIIDKPTVGRTMFSSHVQPSRFISGTSPLMTPPVMKMPGARDALDARDGNRVAVGLIRDARPQHLVELQHLADVVVAAHAGLDEAEIRGSRR